jgi:hypothetical protein
MTRLKLSNNAHKRLQKEHEKKLKIHGNDFTPKAHELRVKSSYHRLVNTIQSQEKKIIPKSKRKIVFLHMDDNSGFGYDMNYLDQKLGTNLLKNSNRK